jgi:glycosyltransferase involved in cell wall biosynthesis
MANRTMIVERARKMARRLIAPPPPIPGSRKRIAFYGPLPPAATGVATYDRAVLDGLGRIGFTSQVPVEVVWPIGNREIALASSYQMGVFQLGNNIEFHLDVYRLIWQLPGLVVLHDLALDDFARGLQAHGDPLGFIAEREATVGRARLSDADIVRNEPLRVPWCASVARRARGIIVHSDFGRRYLEELGCRTPVFVVPHPVVEGPERFKRAEPRSRELRARLKAQGCRFLVVAAGDINEAKRLDAVVRAAAELDSSVHVAFVGRRIEGYELAPIVQAARLGNRARIEHDVSSDDFLAWLLAADVVVDLRYPHRGEVSGSLMRSMQAGRPTVVSATGTYLDMPDDAVLRVSAGPADPSELASTLKMLLDDRDLRLRVGEAARNYTEHLQRTEASARGYAAAIEATLQLVRDPTNKVLGRWAKSLADIGVDEHLLGEGYGLSYARALASFKRSQ